MPATVVGASGPYVWRPTDAVARRADWSARYWGPRCVIVVVAIWATSPFVGFLSALLVVTLAAFAAAMVGVWRPAIGLIGISALCTLEPITTQLLWTSGFWRWNTLNYFLLAVIVMFLPLLGRLRGWQIRGLQAFLVLMAAQLALSPEPMKGVQSLLEIGIVFGLLVYCIRAGLDSDTWYWAGVVCGTLAAGGGLMYYLQSDPLTYMNPNAWAFFPLTAMLAICVSYHVSRGNPRRQRILALLAIVNFAWIYLSSSRGTMLNAFVCMLVVFRGVGALKYRVLFLAVAPLVFWVVSSRFPERQQFAQEKINALLDSQRSAVARTHGRSDIARGGVIIFLNHPITGVGTGGFEQAWINLGNRDRSGLSGFARGQNAMAHSAWIKTMAENGVFGFVLLIIYVGSFAFQGWKRRREGLIVLGVLTTVTLTVAFLSTEFQGKALWLVSASATTFLFREALFGVLPVDVARRRRRLAQSVIKR